MGPASGCVLVSISAARKKQWLTGCIRHNLIDLLLGRNMNTSPLRAIYGVIFALAMLSLASPSSAQQKTDPAPQQAPALSQPQPPAIPAQAAPPVQAPALSAAVPSASAPAASDATATPADAGSRSLKSTAPALRELS